MDHLPEDMNVDYNDPIFFKQPRDAFVIKSRPATLHCRVSQALDIHFKVSLVKCRNHNTKSNKMNNNNTWKFMHFRVVLVQFRGGHPN